MSRDRDQLLQLLAFAAAYSVNAVQMPHYDRAKERSHADAMAADLKMDMRNWFEPTVESYFGRVNKATIEQALTEAKGEEFAKGIAQMKKGEAAAYAADQIAGTGWLPAALKIGNPADVTAEAEATDFAEYEEFQAAAE